VCRKAEQRRLYSSKDSFGQGVTLKGAHSGSAHFCALPPTASTPAESTTLPSSKQLERCTTHVREESEPPTEEVVSP
jgi:hypothetical protein